MMRRMRWFPLLTMLFTLCLPGARGEQARITERMDIAAYDGYMLQGKLDLPASGAAQKLVVFVNGSGPNTYDNRRTTG
ncbi:MAG TPA: hypothetical protein IAC49_04385, partial [Candidatus Ventricola intestinavium]|nr:hypothetical protein [Candidatus Ventricola intestinavium]